MNKVTKFLLSKVAGLLLMFSIAGSAYAAYPSGSPVALNGKLKVSGTKMVNECGNTVQLRGMSTHGPQWFGNCICQEALQTMVDDWGITIFRYAMYVQEQGYVTNPSKWRSEIDKYADYCEQLGIYFLIDWHVLNPGNPNANLNEAIEFWDYMSKKHGSKKHVLFEICNEPNGVQWSTVKEYADKIVSTIRNNDKETIIIVGTPTWSQDVDIASQNKIQGSNIMYTLHFYAGSHGQQLRSKAETAMNNGCAIFVTECGTSSASGDGSYSPDAMRTWVSWMNQHDISWCNWSFADKGEVASALNSGACNSHSWNNTTASGTLVKGLIKENAFKFIACSGANTDNGGNNQNQNGDNNNQNNNQNQNGDNNNQNQNNNNQNQNGDNNNQNNNQNQGGNNNQNTPTVTYPTLTDNIEEYKVFRIVNKKSGLVMAVSGTDENAKVSQVKIDKNDDKQLFFLRKEGDAYLIRSAQNLMVLTNKYNPNPGAEIFQQKLSEYDNPSEKWNIKKTNDKWFTLANKSGNNTVLAVANGSYDAGAAVTQANFSSADEQLWGFEFVKDFDTTDVDVLYNDALALYPAVVDDEFSVFGDFASIEVHSASGVKMMKADYQASYNVVNLPAGVYIVVVKLADGQQKNFKVVKR